MPHLMKALGVKNAVEWEALAWSRPENQDEQAVSERRAASRQMLAIIAASGFTPDEDFLRDTELLITGRMSHEEHRAYLAEKHKEQI